MLVENSNLNIGEKIARFRKLKGWSQQELADRLGLGRTTITSYEANNKELSINQIKDIASALGITLYDFLLDPSEHSSNSLDHTRDLTKDELKEKVRGLELEMIHLLKEIQLKDKMLADKTKIIELYEHRLELYKNQLEEFSKSKPQE